MTEKNQSATAAGERRHFLRVRLVLVGLPVVALFLFLVWRSPPITEGAPPEETPPPTEQLSSDQALRVTLEFLATSWVDVHSDGERTVSELRVQGEAMTVNADNEIRLKLENADAAKIEVNGEPFGHGASDGEEIVIGVEGIVIGASQEQLAYHRQPSPAAESGTGIRRRFGGRMSRASVKRWISYTEPDGVYAAVLERDSEAALVANCKSGSVTVGMQLDFPRFTDAATPYVIDGRSYAGDWSVDAGSQITVANDSVLLAQRLSGGRGFSFDGMYFTLSASKEHLATVLEACGQTLQTIDPVPKSEPSRRASDQTAAERRLRAKRSRPRAQPEDPCRSSDYFTRLPIGGWHLMTSRGAVQVDSLFPVDRNKIKRALEDIGAGDDVPLSTLLRYTGECP